MASPTQRNPSDPVARTGSVARLSRGRAVAVGVVTAVAAVACAGDDGDSAVVGDDADDRVVTVAEVQDLADALTSTEGGPPGVVVTVHRDGEDTVVTSGVADVATGVSPSVDQTMRIASMSKAFSGAAALALVERGVLSIDSTIGDVRPDLPAAWHAVTLAQLLQHTSGLPDFSGSSAFAEAVNASPDVAPPPSDLLGFVADEPLLFAPGSDYAYSNSDNVAVALMVEEVTGLPYADALEELVLDPSGLTRTELPAGPGLAEPLLRGYDTEADATAGAEDVSELVAFGGWAWASGGIASTPAEVGAFIRSLLGGAFFGDAVREEQRDVRPGDSEPPGPGTNAAGLALFRYDTPCGTVWGHTGSILGWTQFMAATPDGAGSVTTTVSTQADDALVERLRELQEAAVCLALEGTG